MVTDQQKTALEQLDVVIEQFVTHIDDFKKNPSDFTRNRKLNIVTLIKIVLNMQGQSLNTEMINAFPEVDERPSESALEQQKAKLTPEMFQYILKKYNETLAEHNLYNNKYMILAIDGSDFNPPYQSKSKYATNYQTGRPRNDGEPVKPYSQMHCNLLYNITDRYYEDCIIQPKSETDERGAALNMLHRFHSDIPYIVLFDRGYDGFNMIENCNRLNDDGYYVIRTKAGNGGIKEIAELPNKECDVEMEFEVVTSNKYYVDNHKENPYLHFVNAPKKHHKKYYSPNTKNQRWDFGWRTKIKCRVCKFRINNPDTGKQEWEVLLTNLNRFEFPLKKMKDLYHKRWDIEVSFRELKYAIGGVQFHSRKDDFVEMEVYAHLIMFNAVSRNINAVKVPQSDERKYEYVVSFKDAVTLTRNYYRLYCKSPPDRIYAEMLSYTRPVVSGRQDKRNMKPKSAVWFVYRVA